MIEQIELPLNVEPEPDTLPIPLPDQLKDALEKWSSAVADVIKGIGAPGDFGYGTKRGDALHFLIRLVDEIYDVIGGRKPWTLRKQRCVASTLRRAVSSVESQTWPKDVRNRLPRFYVALNSLNECTRLVAEVAQ